MNATTPAEAGEAYSPDPLAGTSVRTLRKLGEGSMGVVVEAENIEIKAMTTMTRLPRCLLFLLAWLTFPSVDWFESGKHAMTIHRYVLRGEQVAGEPIFRLAERRSRTLLSEAFHEAVVRNGLKGLLFFPLDATWEP